MKSKCMHKILRIGYFLPNNVLAKYGTLTVYVIRNKTLLDISACNSNSGKTFPVQSFFLDDAVQFTHFVMEEKSPYARPLKQMNAVRQGQSWQTYEEDYNSDPGKPPGERMKDENLTVKQLMYRYSG